jgi:hypothetical protein
MPWRIVKSHYDPLDLTTLHDDEMIAIESALRDPAATRPNETNPAWRAWQKIRPLAEACTGDGDPVEGLPPAARTSPVWAEHQPPGSARGFRPAPDNREH